jgi:uncharacterized protein with von Willebrand factor type A (vWA) domain
MNPEINEFNTFSTESNNDLSIDLSIFTTSLITLRENMTYVDFDSMLGTIERANNLGKLPELLHKVEQIYSQGTDLASAFEHSMFDITRDQEENF